MLAKILLCGASAGMIAGCSARPVQLETIVYAGPRNPVYIMPAHLKVHHRLAEIERQKDDMAAQLHHLGLKCFSVDGDEVHDRVTVRTAELDKVRRAIAEGKLRLPPKFAFLPGGCDRLL